jgi:hypothetical protein
LRLFSVRWLELTTVVVFTDCRESSIAIIDHRRAAAALVPHDPTDDVFLDEEKLTSVANIHG